MCVSVCVCVCGVCVCVRLDACVLGVDVQFLLCIYIYWQVGENYTREFWKIGRGGGGGLKAYDAGLIS